jgi:hypothetical protein
MIMPDPVMVEANLSVTEKTLGRHNRNQLDVMTASDHMANYYRSLFHLFFQANMLNIKH